MPRAPIVTSFGASPPAEIANLAFSGVANIWTIVKRAPALNVAHVLALRIVASEHRMGP